MRTFLGFVSAFAISLCGCATVPDLPDESRVHIPDVVERIRCEFAEAVSRQPKYLGWPTKITLTLQTEAKTNLGGGSVLAFPIHYGTFKISLESNLNRTTTRIASLDFNMKFNVPPGCLLPEERPAHLREFFRSKIGLEEWLDRVSDSGLNLPKVEQASSVSTRKRGEPRERVVPRERAVPREPVVPEEVEFNNIGHVLEFVILVDGKINPSFSIMRPNGVGIDGTATLFGSAELQHKVEIVMTPPDKPPKDEYPKVCVVNKGLGPCPKPSEEKKLARGEPRAFLTRPITPGETQRLNEGALQLRLLNLRVRR